MISLDAKLRYIKTDQFFSFAEVARAQWMPHSNSRKRAIGVFSTSMKALKAIRTSTTIEAK